MTTSLSILMLATSLYLILMMSYSTAYGFMNKFIFRFIPGCFVVTLGMYGLKGLGWL